MTGLLHYKNIMSYVHFSSSKEKKMEMLQVLNVSSYGQFFRVYTFVLLVEVGLVRLPITYTFSGEVILYLEYKDLSCM